MTVQETIRDIRHKVEGAVQKISHPLGFDFDPGAGMIFVTGGNGVVGHRVADRILKAGYPSLRLGVRNPQQLAEMNKQGAELADFCWERDDTYGKALEGVKTVFCTTPHHEGWEEKFPIFLEACKKAGVRNFVKLSFYHARKSGDPFQHVPLVRQHGDCDEQLAKSGLCYTIIAASHLMSNPLVYQGKELRLNQKPARFYGASGEKGVNYVSPNDISEVAVRVLLAPHDHRGKEYTLTGPEAITDQEVASLLGKHLEKPVMYVGQPTHTFEDGEKMSGDPVWLVADLVALERVKATGKEEEVSFISKDFEKLCGHPAENFEEYLLAKHWMTNQELA